MNLVHVFDASALIALFRGYEPVFGLFADADAGLKQVVWPAAAIAEANAYLRAGPSGWEPLLLGRVIVTDLTADGAIQAGLLTSRIATGHVVHEARATLGVVVTQEPGRYAGVGGAAAGALTGAPGSACTVRRASKCSSRPRRRPGRTPMRSAGYARYGGSAWTGS